MANIGARDRLIVALDVPTIEAARALVGRLGAAVGFYKIGLELVMSGGLDLARELTRDKKQVFLDMKLLDIENTVERAVVLSRGTAIEIDDLTPEVKSGGGALGDGRTLSFAVGTPLEEVERRVIHATLAHVGGDKRLCAQLLGIATRTIYRRLEEERAEPEPTAATSAEAPADGAELPNWQGSRAVGSR